MLDPETNLTYAVKYLAGAFQAAHGNHNRAVAYYAGGYYYVAKRQRLHDARHDAMSANAQAIGAPLFIRCAEIRGVSPQSSAGLIFGAVFTTCMCTTASPSL